MVILLFIFLCFLPFNLCVLNFELALLMYDKVVEVVPSIIVFLTLVLVAYVASSIISHFLRWSGESRVALSHM